MIAGLLPWRADMLKKKRNKRTEEEQLLRDGWQFVDANRPLEWKGETWKLLYKVVDERPRKLPDFDEISIIRVANKDGTFVGYQYIEFMAVNNEDKHVELYAYGNFLKGKSKPYLMQGRQVVRIQ